MKIAILAGDGIGPEIMAEAIKVLAALKSDGLKVETESALVGGAAYDAFGQPLPDATLKLAQQADAVLFGSVGGPQYDSLVREHRPEKAILGLRKECDFLPICDRQRCFRSWRMHRRCAPTWLPGSIS